MKPRILALWSVPRSRSTAFLRMMLQRGDFMVLHEPFSRVTDFGDATVGERTVRSEQELIDAIRDLAAERPVFLKDTTDFRYPGLLSADDFLREITHTFMIREPRAVIASHYRLNPDLSRDEIGFAWLYEIFEAAANAANREPIVVDSDELIEHPAEVIREYCRRVDIRYIPAALSWPPGLIDEWQRTSRWHLAASETTGFERRGAAVAGDDITEHPVLGGYLRYHLPYYEKLYGNRLRLPDREAS